MDDTLFDQSLDTASRVRPKVKTMINKMLLFTVIFKEFDLFSGGSNG